MLSESRIKQEITLPEKENSECVVGDFYGHDRLIEHLEQQGLGVKV